MNEPHSIGDGIIVASVAAAFLGYFYFKFREKQRYLEILHTERLAAMEKGIPLPELPIEPLFVKTAPPPDPRVPLVIGAVFLSFGAGAALTLWLMPSFHALWPAPLPLAFIGGGILFAYTTVAHPDRGY